MAKAKRRSAADKHNANLKDFFTVDQHNFSAEGADRWFLFAKQTTKTISAVLSATRGRLPLLEIIQMIADERARFAEDEGHIKSNGLNLFGQLRSGVYDLSLEAAADLWQQRVLLRKKLKDRGTSIPERPLKVSSSLTLYPQSHPLFEVINANRLACEAADTGYERIFPLPPGMDATLNNFMRGNLKMPQPGYFDEATYQRLVIQGMSADHPDTALPLTSYYFDSRGNTPFYLIEHPSPKLVQQLLVGDVEQMFRRVMREDDKTEYLNQLATLLWYCHHLMPFERGSAAIFLIFAASMLAAASIEPKRYGPVRMDIDAISLPQTLFSARFLSLYQS